MNLAYDALHLETLPFFPLAFPDETVGSRISRYNILRGMQSRKETFKQIFNRPPFRVYTMLPPYMDRLATKLPGSFENNLAGLQELGTLAPLLHRFAGATLGIGGSVVLSSSGNKPHIGAEIKCLNYCRTCLEDDKKRFGVPYIHRSHQIPGVMTCWLHGTRLFDRCSRCLRTFESGPWIELSPWLGCVCGTDIVSTTNDLHGSPSTVAKEFSKFAHQILIAPTAYLTPVQLIKIYKHRAIERGLGGGETRTDRKKLYAQIEVFFGLELLLKIDPTWKYAIAKKWCGLLEKKTMPKQLITRHLVLSFFLFIDANLFILRTGAPNSSIVHGDFLSGTDQLALPPAVTAEGPLHAELRFSAEFLDYDQHQLWDQHFYDMKNLMKLTPNSSIFDDVYVRNGPVMRRRSAMRFRAARYYEDLERAHRIAGVAKAMLWGNERPVQVTMTRLQFVPELSISPAAVNFPLTRDALIRGAESRWHFAARRVLWVLMGVTDPAATHNAISIRTGLSRLRARALLTFFTDAPRGCEQSMDTVKAVLKSHSIDLNWQGPRTYKDILPTPPTRGRAEN